MNKTTKSTSPQTVSAVRAGISKSTPQNIIIHRQASEIEMKKINWLWPNRIARGKITMLSGNPGLGKSQLIAYIAGVITNSGIFADKTECIGGDVIILSAEDDAADTIVPRLKAANANLTKVIIISLSALITLKWEVKIPGTIPLEEANNLREEHRSSTFGQAVKLIIKKNPPHTIAESFERFCFREKLVNT